MTIQRLFICALTCCILFLAGLARGESLEVNSNLIFGTCVQNFETCFYGYKLVFHAKDRILRLDADPRVKADGITVQPSTSLGASTSPASLELFMPATNLTFLTSKPLSISAFDDMGSLKARYEYSPDVHFFLVASQMAAKAASQSQFKEEMGKMMAVGGNLEYTTQLSKYVASLASATPQKLINGHTLSKSYKLFRLGHEYLASATSNEQFKTGQVPLGNNHTFTLRQRKVLVKRELGKNETEGRDIDRLEGRHALAKKLRVLGRAFQALGYTFTSAFFLLLTLRSLKALCTMNEFSPSAVKWNGQVLNPYEAVFLPYIANPENLTTSLLTTDGWSPYVKKQVFLQLVTPLRIEIDPRNGLSSLVRPPKGVLLYGPPGCGKTEIAKGIAKDAGATFINVKPSVIRDKYHGESDKIIEGLFSLAKKLQPSIIFIDEIDSLLRVRSDDDKVDVVSTFLQLWEGFESNSEKVCVIGATNRRDTLDEAVSSRMTLQLFVDYPERQTRAAIIDGMEKKHNFVVEQSAKDMLLSVTAGKSIRALRSIVEDAVKIALFKSLIGGNTAKFSADNPLVLQMNDF